MTKNQKGFARHYSESGFAPVVIIMVVVAILILGGVSYVFGISKIKTSVGNALPIVPTDSPQPMPSSTDQTSADPYMGWKTYTTKDNKFSFKYPSDWNLVDNSKDVDLYDDGKLQFQQNITLTKGDYTFTSINPLAWGPGACIYPDSPKFEGPSASFDIYVEITGQSGLYRRAKTVTPPDTIPVTQDWTICSKEKISDFFVTVAWFGTASYKTPVAYDDSYLKTMDKILGSLQTIK